MRLHSPDCALLPRWGAVAETARLYAKGLSYKEIASATCLSVHTVNHHIQDARRHMELCYDTELPGAKLITHLIDAGCA